MQKRSKTTYNNTPCVLRLCPFATFINRCPLHPFIISLPLSPNPHPVTLSRFTSHYRMHTLCSCASARRGMHVTRHSDGPFLHMAVPTVRSSSACLLPATRQRTIDPRLVRSSVCTVQYVRVQCIHHACSTLCLWASAWCGMHVQLRHSDGVTCAHGSFSGLAPLACCGLSDSEQLTSGLSETW